MQSTMNFYLKCLSMKTNTYKSVQFIFTKQNHTIEILNKSTTKNSKNLTIQNIDKQRLMRKTWSNKFKRRNVIMPAVTACARQSINTILGIYIGSNIISWTTLNVKHQIVEWSYRTHAHLSVPGNLSEIIDMALDISSQLPICDAYVVSESISYPTAKANEISLYVQRHQLKILIVSYLRQREQLSEGVGNTTDQESKLYQVNYGIIEQFFKLYVGTETRSTNGLVEKLLEKGDEAKKINEIERFFIDNELRDWYLRELAQVREQMNWSLLTAATFLYIGILQKFDAKFFSEMYF